MESEPGSGSQIKKGRSHRPSNHSRSPSQSHGVTINALPRGVVVDILSRLPTPSLFRAQFVCLSWRALARDPLFLELHRPLPRLPLRPPLWSPLYFVDDVSGRDGRNRPARKSHPPFGGVAPEFNVVGSSEGLLCLANALYSDNVYVYNPLTGEYRELPDSEGHQRKREMVFGFGFDETEKDYKVIKIVYTIINRNGRLYRVLLCCSKVQVCSLRSPTWRRLGNATHDLEATPSQPLVNRRLHWTVSRGGHWNIRIAPFDLHHLVELGGCLSAAVPSLSGALEIWVMKEYGMKESWIKDYSIGSYLPKGLQNHEHEDYNDRSCKISRILMRKRYGLYVRVLGMLRNGKILLEYHNRALARYDPDRDEAIDLMLEGLPEWFESIVHVSKHR
ncbi:hypothetical protein ACJRO7_001616 [Eucalyptus globulus]|uniref:F-box domain-containing protein n=1 Tax=Eucalyptus globulus TaxID=34317 RepID=A0ABD3M1G4_EUCGL